jgi:polysaccharide pyruvyl transferase WcaK-like protein
MMGKKCIILSNGIGPLHGRFAVRLTSRALLSADHVSVRDMDSFLNVISITKGELCPKLSADPVFIAGENRLPFEEKGKNLLGCGARYAAVALNGRFDKENETAAWAIGEFCRRHRIFPVFVSMDPKIDESSARRCAYIGRGVYVKTSDAREVKRILKSSQIAFGSRLHFLIFALLEGVPFVPLFSDPKVDAFSAEVLGCSALRARAVDERVLLKRIERFVKAGFCGYDQNDAVASLSSRVEDDLSHVVELCLTHIRKNAPKPLKKNDLSAIINCD